MLQVAMVKMPSLPPLFQKTANAQQELMLAREFPSQTSLSDRLWSSASYKKEVLTAVGADHLT